MSAKLQIEAISAQEFASPILDKHRYKKKTYLCINFTAADKIISRMKGFFIVQFTLANTYTA